MLFNLILPFKRLQALREVYVGGRVEGFRYERAFRNAYFRLAANLPGSDGRVA